ncbi:MAG: KH domain-containing protein [Nanoarchaeota archaeon]
METIYLPKARDVKENLKLLKEKLNLEIKLEGHKVTFEGEAVDELAAEKVFNAIEFGFTVHQSLQLIDPDILFVKIKMKSATRRKDMKDVRGRIIGREGKTKRTIESISDCEVVINGNEVGIIGLVDNIEAATTGIKNIAKGSKQANVYNYMERMNAEKKKFTKDDLGIKDKNSKLEEDENSKSDEGEDELEEDEDN